MPDVRGKVREARRIVVKVGTSTLTHGGGKVNLTRIDRLAGVLSEMRNMGREAILVTSGAVGIGLSKLRIGSRPKAIAEQQAAAAVGQCELMHIYSRAFGDYGYNVAQVLLTRDVTEDAHKRGNIVNTMESLLSWGVIPIINENDTVSIEELKAVGNFGDNDTLAAAVSVLIKADLLVILTDQDGFYDSDPRKDAGARKIDVIRDISDEMRGFAKGAGSKAGTGGMATKLEAAGTVMRSGIDMLLLNGGDPKIILRALEGGDEGSLFVGAHDGTHDG